jgi:hypothetical protein
VSAADDIVRLLRKRVPDWAKETVEPGLWKFTSNTDPDEIIERYGPDFALVDGRERAVYVLPEQFADKRVGPSLIGYSNGVTTHICFASMLDLGEVHQALGALERMGVLPGQDVIG